MKIEKIQQNKRIVNIVKHTEIFTKCLIKIGEKDCPINLTITYEDYRDGDNFLLSLMIEKLNPWDESCQEYMDIETYIQNCLQKIYSDLDNEKASKQMLNFITQILDENDIVNLWEQFSIKLFSFPIK